MPRYLLIRVDDNARANALRQRVDGVEGVTTVGLYPIPIDFCSGCTRKDPNATSKINRKTGWRCCPVCKKPKLETFHSLKNLIEPNDTPTMFTDCWLSVREPFFNNPGDKYGEKVLQRVREQGHLAALKFYRARNRRVRKRRAPERKI